MANPLVKTGVRLAIKGGKALRKKIKTARNSRNSTDNMTKGPIDKQINKTKANQKGMRRQEVDHSDYEINPNEYGMNPPGTEGIGWGSKVKSGKIKKIIKNVIDIDDPF
tara:strand:+ start:722 stop:1048 length:327 start_codon:yes stop_codon:yes gene_type:complete